MAQYTIHRPKTSPIDCNFECNDDQKIYTKNETKQLKELYNYVKKWNGNGKNLVLITHYSIITAVTNAVPSSGEIVVADKNFKVLGTIPTD